MDQLEKFIRDNREQLMDHEPAAGHMDRFEKRLKETARKTRIIHMTRRISRMAAVALLALMSSLWIYNELTGQNDPLMRLSDVSADMQQVEFYYTTQINQYCSDLKSNELISETDYAEAMTAELEQMDSVYLQLQKELGAHPNDERIVTAMIRHYQTKLQVLTGILEKLEQIQQQNNSNSNIQNQYESVTL